MAAPKRNAAQRERDLETLAALYVRGVSLRQIGEQLGVSVQQVSYDLKILRQRWQESTGRTAAEELAKIDAIEREHWKAWQKTANVRHLEGALSCVERRCKMLGLDSPEKVNVNHTVSQVREALQHLQRAGGDTALAAVLSEPAEGSAGDATAGLLA